MESWIHVNKSSGTGNDEILVTVDANSSDSRTGSLQVKGLKGITKILYIIQKSLHDMDVVTLIRILGDTDGACFVNSTDYGANMPDSYVQDLLGSLDESQLKPAPFLLVCLESSDNGLKMVPYESIAKNGDYIVVKTKESYFNISTDGSGYIETGAI